MKRKTDLLIINNCPSFYKINLYNELNKHCSLHVVFIGLSDQVVIDENFKHTIQFSYELINDIQIENRSKLNTLLQLVKALFTYDATKIIYGGYVEIESVLMMFLTSKKKNCLQFESSIKESKVTGKAALIKKFLFSRFSIVLPSGKLQADVFRSLNYKGKIIETTGVGLMNKADNKEFTTRDPQIFKYVYVGRLIALKNLSQLIRVFNQNGKSLTIVGTGVLEEELKSMAKENISFVGFIPNGNLSEVYRNHDVFVLPSFSETWGLVVEEAVYYGLPVLVSEYVGSQFDMVEKPNTGLIFSPDSDASLQNAIDVIERDYSFYRSNCLNFDFENQNQIQIQAYLKTLSL